jgi:hypothetical protein
MTEWMLPEEKLPEGIEEIMVTMASGGEKPTYQWMIDPVSGPPFEGTAKSAEEAFMSVRAKLTEHAGGFGAEFGGFPDGLPELDLPGLPGAKPPGPPQPNRPPVLKALSDLQRSATLLERLNVSQNPDKEAVVAVDKMVNASLETITKGLVAADIFIETATGEDLRDILPPELLDNLSKELSAAVERRG